jgi:hypothetical protein
MLNNNKKPKGFVIYQGKSLIDGKSISVVYLPQSLNKKTGNMAQTYIIRSDIDPRLASKTGEDYSICGSCKHRGSVTTEPDRKQAKGRTCYVNLAQGVLIVYKQLMKGAYPVVNNHKDIQSLGDNQVVRLGTYGDPSAVPSYIWDSLLSKAKKHTSYTHQSHNSSCDVRSDISMMSADSYEESKKFWSKGLRTFRVMQKDEVLDKTKEVLCPASKEAGRRATCETCVLCSGSNLNAKSVAIYQH